MGKFYANFFGCRGSCTGKVFHFERISCPFNSTVNIDLSIPHETEINIQVFDLLGRIVFLHKQNFTDAGRYKFQWNARNNRGESIPSGIYIVSIQHHKNTHKQKITFLK